MIIKAGRAFFSQVVRGSWNQAFSECSCTNRCATFPRDTTTTTTTTTSSFMVWTTQGELVWLVGRMNILTDHSGANREQLVGCLDFGTDVINTCI